MKQSGFDMSTLGLLIGLYGIILELPVVIASGILLGMVGVLFLFISLAVGLKDLFIKREESQG